MLLLFVFGFVFTCYGLQRAKTAPAAQPASTQKVAPPEELTVDQVTQLIQAGISEEIIIAKIRKNGKPFDLTTNQIIQLKNAKASDNIIKVLMDPKAELQPAMAPTQVTQSQQSPVPVPAAQPQPVGGTPPSVDRADANLPTEVGVYIKKDNQWVEIQPEVVNWKTGGVLKNIASAAIVKGDVNGRISGAHSHNAVKTPLGFLIVAREGEAVTEYQLIKLREQKDAREFRTVTGGVMHVSSGAARDLLLFEGKKVASRTFSVDLPTLGAGEYGFLPPAAVYSGNASASLGKMYTFRVGE